MRNFISGALSLSVGFAWWVADRLYGDEVFSWIRPFLPTQILTLPGLTALLVQYVPVVISTLLAAYFFVRQWQQSRLALDDHRISEQARIRAKAAVEALEARRLK